MNASAEEQRKREVNLPDYPRVLIRDTAIIIVDENMHETVWDYEEDEEEAKIIARDLESGLRAICYVRKQVTRLMNDITEDLIFMDVPLDRVEEYLYEGSSQVINTMARLYRSRQRR